LYFQQSPSFEGLFVLRDAAFTQRIDIPRSFAYDWMSSGGHFLSALIVSGLIGDGRVDHRNPQKGD
jgi:hypothetical protein